MKPQARMLSVDAFCCEIRFAAALACGCGKRDQKNTDQPVSSITRHFSLSMSLPEATRDENS